MNSQAHADMFRGVVQPQPAELQALSGVLHDRDSAIKNGMTVDGQRYEVRCSSSITVAAAATAMAEAETPRARHACLPPQEFSHIV
jgi:hypothetical protein